jgi:hypothetical protein
MRGPPTHSGGAHYRRLGLASWRMVAPLYGKCELDA